MATEKTIKVGRQFRGFALQRSDINTDKRTVALSFSSEVPVERWFGMEILDHSPAAVDLSRLRKGGALLIDHDPKNQVGKIEEATIGADRMGRAMTRFGRSAKAEEIFQDVVDEIRTNVSVGYEIMEMVLEKQQENGPDIYRVTKWMPFEISLVSIPADTNVGVGRSEGKDEREIKVTIPDKAARTDAMKKPECHSMDMEPKMKPEDCKEGEDCANAQCASAKMAPRGKDGGMKRAMATPMCHDSKSMFAQMPCAKCDMCADCCNPNNTEAERKTTPKEVRVMEKCQICGGDIVAGKCSNPKHDDMVQARARASAQSGEEMEKGRVKSIRNLCKASNLDKSYEEMFIGRGYSLEKVSDDILMILEERGKSNPKPATLLGLSASETSSYSLRKAILACDSNDWKDAGLELEANRTLAQKLGKMPDKKRFLVPFEVLQRQINMQEVARLRGQMDQRDLSSATGGVGGYLVQTDNVGFIEALYNRAVVFKMGARRLSGLVGNVAIPRLSVGAAATWLAAQTSTISEQTQTFVQVPLTPKNVGAYTEISRQLMLQSVPGVEGIVSDDLSRAVALAADAGCLNGAGGSGEPDGIIGFDGVGSVSGTALAYDGILEFQTDVADSNVTPLRGGYVSTPKVARLLKQRVKFTNTASPLWEGNIWDGQVEGFPAMTSAQVPAGDMIFGDWSEMVVGEWGVLEIEVNPYAGFTAGIIGVRAIYTMDCAFRRPFAFSIATSIT